MWCDVVWCGVCCRRFDYGCQQYVAGILEEDDASHSDRPLLGKPLGHGGRSFTLYLYDRERHHVSGYEEDTAVTCGGQ